jgi:AAA ATPase domain
MDAVRNPFSPGAGNPPPELAGRAEIIASMETVLQRVAAGRPVQFPILVGLRGVGKTVLLVRTKDLAEALGFLTIEIECHEGKTLPQLMVPGIRKILLKLSSIDQAKEYAQRGLRVLKGFLGGLAVKVGDLEFSLSVDPELGVADTGDLESDLPELIQALGEAAKAAKRPVAFIVDELQYLSQEEFSALIMAMHKINQRSQPVALIGAGLPQILGLAGNSKSYAERLFSYPTVGPLSPDDAREAIRNPIIAEEASIQEDAITQIMNVTQCYPYFIQQWGYDAWNLADGDCITINDARNADDRSLNSLDQSFFKVRLDRCTPSEKKYMRALAQLGSGRHRSAGVADILGVKITSVAPVRNGLIRKGMIFSPSYGDTEFTVPMFDAYMRRAIPDFSIDEV